MTMLDQLNSIPTDAGAGFLAGCAAEIRQDQIEGHPFIFNPLTDELKSLENLLPVPLRQKIARPLATVDAFIAYVNRFKKPETTIYIHDDQIVAEIDHPSPDKPVWQDHSVSVKIERSDSITRWLSLNKKPLSQEDFAEFLEERAVEIVRPEAAHILELVQELHVTKNSAVKSALRSSGKQELAFTSSQEVKGKTGDASIDLPTSFEFRLQPFKRQTAKVEIMALLRVRLREAHPTFVYDLLLVDERLEEARSEICELIKEQTALPVYR